MSIQKPMTKAQIERARKRREKLKDAPAEMRSGSFKVNRHGTPLSKKQKDKYWRISYSKKNSF